MVYVCDTFWDALLPTNILALNSLILICCSEGNADAIRFLIEDKFSIRIGDLSCSATISAKSNEITSVEDICNLPSPHRPTSLIPPPLPRSESIGIPISFSSTKSLRSVRRLVPT